MMDLWECARCGWTGSGALWDRYESRRLCVQCEDPVRRVIEP